MGGLGRRFTTLPETGVSESDRLELVPTSTMIHLGLSNWHGATYSIHGPPPHGAAGDHLMMPHAQVDVDVDVGVGPKLSLRRGPIFDKGGSKERICKGECVSSLDWVWLKGACGAMAS